MRRAELAVWIAYDIPGSYEEMPPNLIDELKRDRRWCQGNLMNARLHAVEGDSTRRTASCFMTGVMAYLSAPLWFLFLLLFSTVQLAIHFAGAAAVLPRCPTSCSRAGPSGVAEGGRCLALVAGTALLPVPAEAAPASSWGALPDRAAPLRRHRGAARERAGARSGRVRVACADPILFHTRFVVMALAGWLRAVEVAAARGRRRPSWGEAVRRHGLHTVFGIVWAGAVYLLNPAFLWWLLPVAGALIVSIPMSVYTSRATLGVRARRAGLFLIPEETNPPPEILATQHYMREAAGLPDFVAAVVDRHQRDDGRAAGFAPAAAVRVARAAPRAGGACAGGRRRVAVAAGPEPAAGRSGAGGPARARADRCRAPRVVADGARRRRGGLKGRYGGGRAGGGQSSAPMKSPFPELDAVAASIPYAVATWK